jgi:hypothetical protein
MKQNINLDILAELCGRLERAWQDRQDRTLVYKLSDEFPEYREDLHEFFADLILGPDIPSNEKIARAEDRVAQWLGSSAFELAMAAATPSTTTTPATISAQVSNTESRSEELASGEPPIPPREAAASWLVFLRRRTKQNLPNLAHELNNVTTEYLVLVGRHPHLVPQSVKTKIAQDVERAWGVPVEESFSYLSQEPQWRRAASRARPFEREPKTFEELLDRAHLSNEQKALWLRYAGAQR